MFFFISAYKNKNFQVLKLIYIKKKSKRFDLEVAVLVKSTSCINITTDFLRTFTPKTSHVQVENRPI